MELKFFGRGCGFSDEHTSAYFSTENKEMVIIDCPVLTFQKLRHMDLNNYEKFYFLITHTHGDHIGGLGLFVQYAFYVLKKPVVIVAPSKTVRFTIFMLLTNIEGIEPSCYNLVESLNIMDKKWFCNEISTEHDPNLECFGYRLIIDDTNIIYTGDTSTLQPYLPYLTDFSVLYVDTSVYYGGVHLKLEDILDDLISFTQWNIKVYLMHLDNIPAAEKIVADIPNIEVVSEVVSLD